MVVVYLKGVLVGGSRGKDGVTRRKDNHRPKDKGKSKDGKDGRVSGVWNTLTNRGKDKNRKQKNSVQEWDRGPISHHRISNE